MAKVKFGDVVRDVKNNVDRNNNPYDYYVAGDHMDSEDLKLHRRGSFKTDDVGPAFVRIFKKGQILYGSRRTYLKKIAVAHYDGICANTTFVFETKDPQKLDQKLLPFIMLSNKFTQWSISHSKGSTNPYVLFSDLANFEFELPNIEVQNVMAHKLWAAYKLKESYNKLLEKTDEMLKSSDLEPKTKFASKGDLIIAITSEDTEGSCKSTAWLGNYPVAVGGHAAIFHHCMNPLFMSFFFKSPMFNYAKMKYIHGTKVCEIKPDDIAKISVPCPPMNLQEQFAEIAYQADKSKFELNKCIENIDQVIKSLINSSLT